jgi:hypothetical protein
MVLGADEYLCVDSAVGDADERPVAHSHAVRAPYDHQILKADLLRLSSPENRPVIPSGPDASSFRADLKLIGTAPTAAQK